MTTRRSDRVAVVGLGCVLPGASDVDAFWRNVVDGTDATSAVPDDRIDPALLAGLGEAGVTHRGGFVPSHALDFDPARFGIMPVAVSGTEPDQLLALRTAAEALDDVGDLAGLDRSRVGVVLGRGGYLTPGIVRLDQRVRMLPQVLATLTDLLPDLGPERLAEVADAFVDRLGPHHPESSIGLVPNLAASRTANRLDLGGPAYTVDAACASALVAVDQAVRELRSGRCDLVLAGGVHHCHDITLWSVFDQLGALSREGRIRPFSRHADGIVIGEGTAVLALERLEDAERMGHRVYATIAGTGIASDGRDASLMSPRVEGQVSALEHAYRDAGIDPATVGLVEGHGTATAAGDQAELDTIRRVFGKHEGDGPRAVLGSVKSMIGHAMPAAGAAGLVKAVLAVHHGVLPPTLGAEDPHPALADTRFRTIGRSEPWEPDHGPRRAGVDAFGFGGINGHVLIESHGHGHGHGTPVTAPAALSASPVANGRQQELAALVLAGTDAADVLAQLDEAILRIEGGALALLPARAPVGGPVRLAVVGPTAKRLALARRLVAKGRPWRGRNDIWFTDAPMLTAGGRIAFAFPGVEPTFDAVLEPVAVHFGRRLTPIPEGSSDLEVQGFQIFGAGLLLHDVLGDLGIVPAAVLGHSLGEWTGLFTAGVVPPAAAEDFLAGLDVGALELPGVVYLALGCGAEVAAELVAGVDSVEVSHDNCPHQSVVCGTGEGIVEVRRRMADRRIMGQEMPFRSGFHSRHFAPFLEVVQRQWERMPIQDPTVPLWSATTCAPYPADPAALRALSSRHLLEPVRFRELVGRLHDDGVRAFVQVGVGSTVGFVEDTLRDREHLAIAAHSGRHDGIEQLARVALALWVEGASPDLAPLVGGVGATDLERAPARADVRLSLGVPLVHLDTPLRLDPVGTDRPMVPTEHDPDDPFAALHATLVAETLDASRAVLDAFATGAPSTSRAATPSVAEAVEQVRVIDLATMPWLADHAFYRQPDGWSDDDRFPLVPMTGMVELLAEIAAELHPGRVVVEVSSVRAMRWLPAAPPTEVTLRARRRDGDSVDASIDGYARAVVRFADRHPVAPEAAAEPLVDPRPSPLAIGEIYAGHHLFHGPAFQAVRSVEAMGANGADGTVEVRPAAGATLDAAGQIYGWWVMESADANFLALPSTIERIEYFSELPVGTVLDCTARIVAMDDRTVEADLELLLDGTPAVRITGWVDRRFDSTAELWAMLRDPEEHLLSHLLADGVAVAFEGWPDSASRELIARRYLDAEERRAYDARNPRAQRHHLLGRIAAKDALRWRTWLGGAGPRFPVEHRVANDPDGRPFVEGEEATVSIAHTSWVGAAMVGEPGAAPVGVDVEAVEPRTSTGIAAFAAAGELALLPGSPSPETIDPVWATRLWCAKEAAGKAAGTGLAGRPRDLVLTAVDGERLRIGDRWTTTVALAVPPSPASGIPRAASTDPHRSVPSIHPSPEEQISHVVAYTDPDR